MSRDALLSELRHAPVAGAVAGHAPDTTKADWVPDGPDPCLRVRTRRPSRGVAVLHTHGVLDAASEPRFAEVLRYCLLNTAPTLVLDLSGVTFLDTAGAITLLEAACRTEVQHRSLVLVSSPAVDRLLGLAELADRFHYAPTVHAATGGEPAATLQERGADRHRAGTV